MPSSDEDDYDFDLKNVIRDFDLNTEDDIDFMTDAPNMHHEKKNRTDSKTAADSDEDADLLNFDFGDLEDSDSDINLRDQKKGQTENKKSNHLVTGKEKNNGKQLKNKIEMKDSKSKASDDDIEEKGKISKEEQSGLERGVTSLRAEIDALLTEDNFIKPESDNDDGDDDELADLLKDTVDGDDEVANLPKGSIADDDDDTIQKDKDEGLKNDNRGKDKAILLKEGEREEEEGESQILEEVEQKKKPNSKHKGLLLKGSTLLKQNEKNHSEILNNEVDAKTKTERKTSVVSSDVSSNLESEFNGSQNRKISIGSSNTKVSSNLNSDIDSEFLFGDGEENGSDSIKINKVERSTIANIKSRKASDKTATTASTFTTNTTSNAGASSAILSLGLGTSLADSSEAEKGRGTSTERRESQMTDDTIMNFLRRDSNSTNISNDTIDFDEDIEDNLRDDLDMVDNFLISEGIQVKKIEEDDDDKVEDKEEIEEVSLRLDGSENQQQINANDTKEEYIPTIDVVAPTSPANRLPSPETGIETVLDKEKVIPFEDWKCNAKLDRLNTKAVTNNRSTSRPLKRENHASNPHNLSKVKHTNSFQAPSTTQATQATQATAQTYSNNEVLDKGDRVDPLAISLCLKLSSVASYAVQAFSDTTLGSVLMKKAMRNPVPYPDIRTAISALSTFHKKHPKKYFLDQKDLSSNQDRVYDDDGNDYVDDKDWISERPKDQAAAKARNKYKREQLKHFAILAERKVNQSTKTLKYLLEDDEKNCTFRPITKSEKSLAVARECGYDFINEMEDPFADYENNKISGTTTKESFISRLDKATKKQRQSLELLQKMAEYADRIDKKKCKTCGTEQSYDEMVKKKIICCRCVNEGIYTNNYEREAFHRRKWNKRIEETAAKNKNKWVKLVKEILIEKYGSETMVPRELYHDLLKSKGIDLSNPKNKDLQLEQPKSAEELRKAKKAEDTKRTRMNQKPLKDSLFNDSTRQAGTGIPRLDKSYNLPTRMNKRSSSSDDFFLPIEKSDRANNNNGNSNSGKVFLPPLQDSKIVCASNKVQAPELFSPQTTDRSKYNNAKNSQNNQNKEKENTNDTSILLRKDDPIDKKVFNFPRKKSVTEGTANINVANKRKSSYEMDMYNQNQERGGNQSTNNNNSNNNNANNDWGNTTNDNNNFNNSTSISSMKFESWEIKQKSSLAPQEIRKRLSKLVEI